MSELTVAFQEARALGLTGLTQPTLARLVATSTSLEDLRACLVFEHPSWNSVVFRRVHELLGDDIDMAVAYAIWLYHHGRDDDAEQQLETARRISPFDYRVLVLQAWMSYGGSSEATVQCLDEVLRFHPGDEWASRTKADFQSTSHPSMRLPALNLHWMPA